MSNQTSKQRTAIFRSARKSSDFVVLEGLHAVKHALRFGAHVRQAFTNDHESLRSLVVKLAPDLTSSIATIVEQVSDNEFSDLAPGRHKSPVIALAERARYGWGDFASSNRPVVLLENTQHLGNIGAVIRVAAAAGAAGVIAIGEIDIWHPTIVRAAAGLHFAIPVMSSSTVPDTELPIVAIDPDGSEINPASLPQSSVLAFGSEQDGLSDRILSKSSMRVALPMQKSVSSLNLATAAAIVLYSGWVFESLPRSG